MTQPLIQPTQIRVGTGPGDIVQLNGSSQLPAIDGSLLTGLNAGGGFSSIQIFTTSGTWNRPVGITKIVVVVIAGGGGGGGAIATVGGAASGGSGGGGGGAARKLIDVTSLSSETVTVGAGAAGVSSGSAGTGGSSSFGAFCSATGGAGGGTGSSTSVAFAYMAGQFAGGIGTGGDENFRGGFSFHGAANAAGNVGLGGSGGGTLYGPAQGFHQNVVPPTPENYGCGGSGAGNNASQSARSGGNGADGIVIIWEYE